MTELAGTVPAIAVAVAVPGAEWFGRRTASRPQPAQDAAGLYVLDAWRADVVTSQFHDLGLIGSYVTLFLVNHLASVTASAVLLVTAVGLVLLMAGTSRDRELGITWTGRRLWPSLPDGQTVDAETVTP